MRPAALAVVAVVALAGPATGCGYKLSGTGTFLPKNIRTVAIAPFENRSARPEIDIRTTPETDGRRLYGLVRAHVERAGYHLVEGEPTDAERAQFDKLARFTLGQSQAAMRMPIDSAVGRWANAALRARTAPQPGEAPVQIRMMGGTVPTDVLIEALQLPFLLVPTVNDDNNQHAANENLRIGHFVTGTEIIYSLLTTPYRP